MLALRGISSVPWEKLPEFGNEKLKFVLDHLGTPKTLDDGSVVQPVLDSEAAQREWSLLKQMVRYDPTDRSQAVSHVADDCSYAWKRTS